MEKLLHPPNLIFPLFYPEEKRERFAGFSKLVHVKAIPPFKPSKIISYWNSIWSVPPLGFEEGSKEGRGIQGKCAQASIHCAL